MAKLPRALRVARSARYAHQGYSLQRELDRLNSGMRAPINGGDIPDGMRGSSRLSGDQTASINAIAAAGRLSNRR
jgi:hypothetical protein